MAADSASTSSASASPEPEPKLAKTKTKAAAAAEKNGSHNEGRNEGTDAHWAYSPPTKSVRLEESADMGEFDWDALKDNPDLELWLVRIPEGVKPKYLETAQLELPSGSKRDSKKSAKLGMLQRKHVAYDIWSVGEDEPEEMPIAGEEVKGLSCLLPRKTKKGKLYSAPTPIARTIVMAAQPAKPTLPESSSTSSPNVYRNPPRESHPIELLSHSFVPYGAAEPAEESERAPEQDASMDVDGEVLVPASPEIEPKSKKGSKKNKDKGEKLKGKKRKGDEEGESPKKPKKVKTA
ncbi:hypothetical protein R3P38DRAFT_2956223, partial [Favolaschia claudopus]